MKIGLVMRKQNSEKFDRVAMKLCHAYETMNVIGRKNLTMWFFHEGDAEMCRETLEEECNAQFVRYIYMKIR